MATFISRVSLQGILTDICLPRDTPLHLAQGCVQVAKTLLQAGADPTLAVFGWTPFLFAVTERATVGPYVMLRPEIKQC
jgi:hypothetical protein